MCVCLPTKFGLMRGKERNSLEFCYWLQGYFEVSGKAEITEGQAIMIKEHLQLVFTKSTKELSEIQAKLVRADWENAGPIGGEGLVAIC